MDSYFISNLNCYYSKSDDCRFTVVAFSDKKIGVDVEQIAARVKIVKHLFLNEQEKMLDKNNLKLLTKIWTIKEAAIKAFNLSLSSLKEFTVKYIGKERSLFSFEKCYYVAYHYYMDDHIISFVCRS